MTVEVVAAFQFLTRLPVPASEYAPDLLGRAAKFFPLVGLAIGLLAALVHNLAGRWWGTAVGALVTLTFLVLITGGFHEDALADAADGFGGGWTREGVLEIMRDSRIGSYGGIAIGLSLLWRYVLLTNLPEGRFATYLVAAHVLCRWTTLPLSCALAPARIDGAGVAMAQRISKKTLAFGSVLTFAIVFACLRSAVWIPLFTTAVLVLISGWYYRRRLGGVTGDCFGATNQISEIAVYFCGCALAAR
jgi:adenosylcobinamide-GDP ribazoletransferase